MTSTGEEPRSLHPNDPPVPTDHRSTADQVLAVCPYLVGADGGWRSSQPNREHRCGAIDPPALLSVAKQRALCLQRGHERCATFVAARELDRSTSLPVPAGGGGLWPATRSTLLALELARGRVAALPGGRGRTGSQALLAGLMVLAFLVLVIARTTPPSGSGRPGTAPPDVATAAASATAPSPVGSPTAGPSPTAPPSAHPSPSGASPSPTAPPSTSPSPQATQATPSPAAVVRYTVKRGDTLSSIAAAHGTTVRRLKQANGLTSNIIRAGQRLVIP